MSELDDEIAAFEAMRSSLEPAQIGKWVIVHDRKMAGVFDSFDKAASEAVAKFGRGPYLIRQIGAEPSVTMPASVMYMFDYA